MTAQMSGPQAAANLAAVAVGDQSIVDARLVIDKIISIGPGWLVIHADNSGKPGAVLGFAAVRNGENLNVIVAVDTARATPVVYAMLHTDAGVIGNYEFPGADGPQLASGVAVSPPFKILGIQAASASPAPSASSGY